VQGGRERAQALRDEHGGEVDAEEGGEFREAGLVADLIKAVFFSLKVFDIFEEVERGRRVGFSFFVFSPLCRSLPLPSPSFSPSTRRAKTQNKEDTRKKARLTAK
jgi:hypothetical protein